MRNSILTRPAWLLNRWQANMSVVIYSDRISRDSRIAVLSPDEFLLPALIPALEDWLAENKSKLTGGSYIADVGFAARQGATGGGPVLTPEFLRTMADVGMSLYLSEYASEESVQL